eukprot:GHVO01045280.1.p1 GENE.GHVO01045280.1~~GHVO01045280.1.p1  ORF type:complete len:116 (+),score=17.04 GHVO01045280.1:102-449(+)
MASKIITWSELGKHNTMDSLWLAMDGKCYDVTEFIKEHPGGPKPIKYNSGKDATEAFEKVKHSDDAKEWREKFLIGTMEEKKCSCVAVLTHPLTLIGIAVPLTALIIWRVYKSRQ